MWSQVTRIPNRVLTLSPGLLPCVNLHFSHLAQRLRSDFSIRVFGGKQDKRPLVNLNKRGIYLKAI